MRGASWQSLSRTFSVLPILCISIGCTSIDLTGANLTALPEGEALAYGHIKVFMGDKAAQWQSSALLAHVKQGFDIIDGRFLVHLVNESSDAHFDPEIYNDGSFYWHLPPGKYFIIGYEWIRSGGYFHTRIHGPIRAHMEIPSRSAACYLGSLRIAFQDDWRSPYRISVIDELEEAGPTLVQKFPHLKIDSQRCIFKVEAPL